MTTAFRRRFSLGPALVVALAAGACNSGAVTPTSPDSSVPPADQTFASQLAAGGRASRSFPVPETAVVTATLSEAGTSAKLGMGLGIPDTNGAHCHLFSAVETLPGTEPQVTETVEAGTYCVELWDPGALAETISFRIDIAYH